MTSRSSLLGVLLSLGVGFAAHSAAAQDPGQCAGLPADRTELFSFLIRNPANVCATLRYAQLSTKAGDLEAAIGALERVLFYDPAEPNTRLFLGLLYSRLGSNDMARGYFESVLEHPDTPQAIKDRATYLMAQATDQMEPSQWHGFVRTGLRWQSNANYAVDGEYIAYDPSNNPFDAGYFDAEGDPKSDWNAYAQGGVFYSYDFGNQRGDAFEASLTTYNTRQFDLEEYNFNQAEAIVGVRFGIPTGDPTALASIKPYLITSGSLLDDEALYWDAGAGVQGTLPIANWTLGGYAQAIWREYDQETQDTLSDVDEFSGETGWVYSAGVRIASDPRAAQRFQLHLGYERRDVDDPEEFSLNGWWNGGQETFTEDYLSYDRFVADMRVPFDLYHKGHHILVTPLVGVRYTHYDEVDPYAPAELDGVGNPTLEKRKDFQYRAGFGVDYAISDSAGIGMQLLYTVTDSNLPAYDTDNMSVSFGPHFRF